MYLTFSVTWFTVIGSILPLPEVRDGDNDTCHGLDIEAGRLLLKSNLDVPFKTLKVTILITGAEVVFFPNNDISLCKKHMSLLMAHDSSTATTQGHTCKPFCEVPGPCRLEEIVMLATGKINYEFTCVCPQASCNELFVMFQPEAVQGGISICGVQMLYP